jgi:two-component system nitrate/nitrite response regulator NarL
LADAGTIGVVLVSEIQLYREGLAVRLAAEPGLELIASLDSLPEALRLAAECSPDLVLFNVSTTSQNLSALSSAVASLPGTRFVALGVGDLDGAMGWVEVGVAGFLEQRCSPRMAAALLQRVRELSRLRHTGNLGLLTARELEILRMVGEVGIDVSTTAMSRSYWTPVIADRETVPVPPVGADASDELDAVPAVVHRRAVTRIQARVSGRADALVKSPAVQYRRGGVQSGPGRYAEGFRATLSPTGPLSPPTRAASSWAACGPAGSRSAKCSSSIRCTNS